MTTLDLNEASEGSVQRRLRALASVLASTLDHSLAAAFNRVGSNTIMKQPSTNQQPPVLPQKKAVSKIVVVGGTFLLGLFLLVVISSWNDSDGSKKPDEASPPTIVEAPISWREIDAIYNLNGHETDLRKDDAWKRYKGRAVRWTGAVTEVSDEALGGLTLQIRMNNDTLTSDLMVYLDESEKEKAMQLRVGNLVTFTGKLDQWGTLLPITLKDGQIVESGSR